MGSYPVQPWLGLHFPISKKQFVVVLFQLKEQLFVTYCYVPKCISFRSWYCCIAMSGVSVTHCALFTFVYILPSESPNDILFINQYF